MFAGCFAPGGEIESAPSTEAGTDGGETDDDTTPATTDQPTGGMTTMNPTSGTTTDVPTTGNPTTNEPTTGNPTTDEPTTDDSSDPTSGGEDPFCGDGNVDAGEECDDGLDNNGLDQGCLPDCNLNVCGDSNIGPDEFCDDGEGDNVLEVGACAPDCSTVIEEKVITTGAFVDGGNLGPNPVAAADGACESGYRAMFVVPGLRVATTEPYGTAGSTDWVLSPYTAYVNYEGAEVWTTDETPLLGVREGTQQDLLAPLTDENSQNLFDYQIATGLSPDWTASNANTCNGWTSSSDGQNARFGLPVATAMPDVINDFGGPCSDWSVFVSSPPIFFTVDGSTFYCVEQ